ncbi:ATP synthase mitochondrial F1 complex assembly factor 1 [Diorhabda carinulata]|uniref:ATP synthase mitochondrial F1 complex assembly factor 1 n=1 Tax=Diorhabda carinulata TaxID=1163345 RepID=UPI0025A2FE76|nr:ATP synthase mitochondrial F1 complex assembly factor 1 [Diorhabda carinulata]
MHITSLMRNVLYKASFRVMSKPIMTTPRNLQEVLDDLKGNPFYDKYAQKIAKLHKEDPNELKVRLENANKNKKKKADPIEQPNRQYSQLLQPKEKLLEPTLLKQEKLDSIMKTDLIETKNSEEIKYIWEEYHRKKEHCIAATIPSEDYIKLNENAAKYPTFLFALPRSQGYEFIMCQFAQNTVHFTPLLYYQVHKADAPECLTITHYDEYKDTKGLVLMRGEYDKNIINAQEAQCLANQIQMYYVQHDPEKKKLLEVFTKEPDKFKHTDLIKQIENLSIS